jgi:hypothetical protein
VKARAKAEAVASWLGRRGRWDLLVQTVRPVLRRPGAIKSCLRRAGAAHRLEDIGVERERFCEAVLQAPAMRARFTSLDLGFLVSALPGAIEEIVDTWLVK